MRLVAESSRRPGIVAKLTERQSKGAMTPKIVVSAPIIIVRRQRGGGIGSLTDA